MRPLLAFLLVFHLALSPAPLGAQADGPCCDDCAAALCPIGACDRCVVQPAASVTRDTSAPLPMPVDALEVRPDREWLWTADIWKPPRSRGPLQDVMPS